MLSYHYPLPSKFYCRGMKAYMNNEPSWHGHYIYRGEALLEWEAGHHEAMITNNYLVRKDADDN